MWKLSLKNFIQFYLLCCNLVLIQPSFLAVCRAGPILTQIIIWVQCTKTPKIYIEVFFALKYYVSFLYIRFSPFQGFYTYVYDTKSLTSIYCTRTLYTTSTFQCYQFSIIYANMVYWCTLSYLYDWGIGSIPVVGFPLKELVVLIF